MRDVVLIGPPDDPQIHAVGAALERIGMGYRLWDSARWPGEARATLSSHPPRFVGPDGDASDPGAIYVRDLELDPRRDRHAQALHERPLSLLNQLGEYRGLIASSLMMFEHAGVKVVNSPSIPPVHGLKPWQMARFEREGIPIPDTLATNDPEAVRSFAARHSEVIYKPVAGGAHVKLLESSMLVPEALSRLANAPVLFQERVHGDNVRVFVCDGEVVAAGRILSEALDYRTSPHDVERVVPFDALARAAIRASAVLGLSFSGVDAIVTGDRFWILEANPSPMFALFDQLAHTRVASHLADVLAGACK